MKVCFFLQFEIFNSWFKKKLFLLAITGNNLPTLHFHFTEYSSNGLRKEDVSHVQ